MNWPDVVARTKDALDAIRRRTDNRVVAGIGMVVFVIGGWLSVRALNVEIGEIHWTFIVVAALLGVPATSLLNTVEFLLGARFLQQRFNVLEAFRINVIANASNMLPIPGAVVVRAGYYRARGTSYKRAATTTVVIGLSWVGVSCLIAGLAVFPARPAVASAFGAVGVATMLVAGLAARGLGTTWSRVLPRLLAVEAAGVVTDAMRLWLMLAAVSVTADGQAVLVLAVSGALAGATGLLPGGFGIREAIAAGLAPAVGLPPSAGFLAAAMNRALGIVIHAPLAGGSLTLRKRNDRVT